MNKTKIALAICEAFDGGYRSSQAAAEKAKTLGNRDTAKLLLIEAEATRTHRKNLLAYNGDGKVVGLTGTNKNKAAKEIANRVNNILRIAFSPKKGKSSSKFDAAASAKAFVSKHTAGQTKRYIAELKALV